MAAKRKQEIKEFPKKPCNKCPYKSVDDIGPLVFRDKFYTFPAIKNTANFMEHMLECHPDDLEFLWEKSQEYVGIEGAAYRMDFPRWHGRAVKNLEQYKQKGEIT